MSFSRIILTVNEKFRLEMPISQGIDPSLNYTQTLYKARELNRMLKLGLRKVGATPFFARRVTDKKGHKSWSFKTNIQMF